MTSMYDYQQNRMLRVEHDGAMDAIRRGRPPLPPPSETDQAISAAIFAARRGNRMAVRELLVRMQHSLSAPAYSKFEAGRRAVSSDILADICRVLELDVDEVRRHADAAVAEPGAATARSEVLFTNKGPEVPAIRVRVELLMAPQHTWLDPVRGMLRLLAKAGMDAAGDLLLEEPLIKMIAQSADMSLLACWIKLTGFIERDGDLAQSN